MQFHLGRAPESAVVKSECRLRMVLALTHLHALRPVARQMDVANWPSSELRPVLAIDSSCRSLSHRICHTRCTAEREAYQCSSVPFNEMLWLINNSITWPVLCRCTVWLCSVLRPVYQPEWSLEDRVGTRYHFNRSVRKGGLQQE